MKQRMEIRVRFLCSTCHRDTSYVFKKKPLRKSVVFDTRYLRCRDCYEFARDQCELEFIDDA